jgi:hypothetical protein
LTSPVYCSNDKPCHVSPSQQTDIGTTMKASFGVDSEQHYFIGALLYKLQKKHVKIAGQHNSSVACIEDIIANIHLLVIWNVDDDHHRFRVCLIECTDESTWDEDKLWALYWKYNRQIYENYKSSIVTWLMHDGTVMKMRRDITYGSDYKLDIVISEGARKYNMEEPLKINPKRLVLSLSIMIMLIYVISFSIQP